MKKIIIYSFLFLFLLYSEVFAVNPLDIGVTTSNPLVVDIDDDGVFEIVIPTEKAAGAIRLLEIEGEELKEVSTPPWPRFISGIVHNTVNYYIDGDEKYLLYAEATTSKCTVYSATKNGDTNWEKEYDFVYMKAPIADPETENIYVSLTKTDSSSGEMAVLDYSGNEVWTKNYTSGISSNAIVEDINVDGEKELLYHTDDGNIEVLDRTFSPLKGFPKKLPQNASDCFYDFAVKDINNNRYKEIIISSGFTSYQYFFVFDYTGKKLGEIKINQKCREIPEVYDFDNDGTKEIIITSTSGKIYVKDLKGKDISPWPVQAGDGSITDIPENELRKIIGKPILLDTDGDGKTEILVAALDGDKYKLKIFNLKGNLVDDSIELGTLDNYPLADFYSIADIDNDTKLDVIFYDNPELKIEPLEAQNKTVINEVHRTIEYK